MKKTTQAKLLKTDIKFIKENFNTSIANAVHLLLWGKNPDHESLQDNLKELVAAYIEKELRPHMDKKIESIEESINSKIDSLLTKTDS